MRVQLVLHNQCNTDYLDESCTHVIVACVDINTIHHKHVGFLQFHPLSKCYAYACQYEYTQLLCHQGYNAWFGVGSSWYEIIASSPWYSDMTELIVMEPAEPYIVSLLDTIRHQLSSNVTYRMIPNTQFIVSRQLFSQRFSAPPVMETFYRWMRKQYNILLCEDGTPLGGKWNYDKENRSFDKTFVDVQTYTPPLREGWRRACDHYRIVHDNYYPVTRKDALAQCDFFITHLLNRFGELEDAMYTTSHSVFHSQLSAALNIGLLTPYDILKPICDTITPINNKEGFVRQLVGWREYMYQWMWHYADTVYTQNVFSHTRSLPKRFWQPDASPTQMNCVDTVLHKVYNTAYAHHIERLMVIGNFCLLMGYNPLHVTKWFWEMYIDAYERVVTPNVMGMSQYADGGKLATKPYVASANYIDKMSNYCKTCVYAKKEKYTHNACPLNYLYRSFVYKNKKTFASARQSFLLGHLDKIDHQRIDEQVQAFIRMCDTRT